MGDLIEAAGYVLIDFRSNNHVVQVRLRYFVYSTEYGYEMEISNVDAWVATVLFKIKAKILRFIIFQALGKLPSTCVCVFKRKGVQT